LVVSRAGATTIAELAVAKKALVLIPADFLSGGHQSANAELLREAQAAVVLPGDTTAEEFSSRLTALLKDSGKRRQLAEKLAQLARPRAAEELAGLILESAAGKGNP
jgi:UDP-N-acetylglucosamine--N-acetylmuramyl-(pentapeptide) pyrophosphoryl-undecaprenol N-acetylglucosamine transferase